MTRTKEHIATGRGEYFDISGKVFVVTGGLGLIGLNYVEVITRYGGNVVIIDIMSGEKADVILRKKFPNKVLKGIRYYCGDITNKDELVAIKKKISRFSGGVDVLVNNAAFVASVNSSRINTKKDYSFENLELDEWKKYLDVNITGPMLCCQVFGVGMKPGSSIINVSSIYGVVSPDHNLYSGGYKKPLGYSVSKGSILMLTKYLAAYWGHKQIKVNCLVLGGVQDKQDENFIKKYSKKTPLGRMARPDDFNGALIFLSSDASSYCTGAVLHVDGGWTVQ